MNTIKTLFVTATLLAVGYGTHIVLNRPSNESQLSEERIWDHQGVELTGVPNATANIELPPLEPANSTNFGSANPFSQPTSEPDPISSNPFATGSPSLATSTPQPTTRLVDVPGNRSVSSSVGEFGGRPDLGIQSFDNPSPPAASTPSVPHIASAGLNLELPATVTPPIAATPQPAATIGPLMPPVSQLAVSQNNAGSSGQIGAMPMTYQQPVTSPSNAPITATSPMANSSHLATATPISGAAFAETWQTAQTQIGRGELAGALGSLSSIYNQPMNNMQRDQLVALLDQLAGTVIYSQQHLLHAAYAPRAGETIAQIATRQRVPADFLARVNGINPQQPLTPQTQLKIVTGPFRGEISPSRRELTIFLGPHYAGRFAISLGNDFPARATSFEVFEKSGARAYVDGRTGQQIPAGHPMSPFGSHWIGLRSGDLNPGVNCGLHSVGAGLDAADSRGCIGLSDADADDLKAILELGSAIMVVP